MVEKKPALRKAFWETPKLGEHEKRSPRVVTVKEVTHKMKSGKRDKAEGALYRAGSRVLEAVGSLTGDRKKKAKGRFLGRGYGTTKGSEGRLKGLFKK